MREKTKIGKIKTGGLALILVIGMAVLVWIWFSYNAQLKEIDHAIERVNHK